VIHLRARSWWIEVEAHSLSFRNGLSEDECGLDCMYVTLLVVGIGSNVGFVESVFPQVQFCRLDAYGQAKFGCCISGLNFRLRCIILVGFDHPALMLSCSELLQFYQTNFFLIIPLHLRCIPCTACIECLQYFILVLFCRCVWKL